MPIFKRSEGVYVQSAPAMRKMMPHLMPTRNEAAVYFEHVLDLTKTLPFLEQLNAGRERKEFSLFHLILCAMSRTFAMRPQLNRFVVGRRIYQRTDIQFSFAIKREFSDEGGMTTTKLTFAPDETLRSIAEKVKADVGNGRKGEKTQSDKELDVVTKLPRSGLRFLMWFQKALDYVNLLPGFMIKPDPLYCSMFFTNLGSVGLDSAYHHLYEYGTCPFFAAVGKIKKAVVVGGDGQPAVRDVVSMKFVFDERITDGLYCSRSLELFKRLVENPEELEGSFPQNV
jgi:hypothetical protein